MHDIDTAGNRQPKLTDYYALARDCWAIPYDAERELGSAAQLLGGMERTTNQKGITFSCMARIAEASCLSTRTAKRMMPKIINAGWVENRGRVRRRTNTLALTERFFEAMNQGKRLYPRFAGMEWTWGARCVFAHIWNGQAAHYFSKESRSWQPVTKSIRQLSQQSGLSRPAVKDALQRLYALGYIDRERNESGSYQLSVSDAPLPLIASTARHTHAVKKVALGPCRIWHSPPEESGTRS